MSKSKNYQASRPINQTKKYNSEEKLEQSAQDWRDIFDGIADIVVLISSDYRFIKANKAACKALGMTEKELLGKKCYELVHKLDHLTKDCPCAKSIESKKTEVGEFSKRGKYYLTTASPILDKNKKLMAFVHTIKDITEQKKVENALKESEEKYKLLIESSGAAIIFTDREGKFLFINRVGVKWGGGKPEDFIGKRVHDLFPKEKADEYVKRFNQVVDSGKGIHIDEYEKTLEKWISTNLQPVRNAVGKIIGVQCIIHDITKRKKVEQEKQKLQDQLKKYTKQLETKVKKTEIKLNQKEKLVLTALTCYPNYNDCHLARVINLKRSTITAIRNRLKQNGWYQKINIPNFNILNCGTLYFIYHYNIHNFNKNIINQNLIHLKNQPNNILHQISDSFSCFFIAYKNIAEAHQYFQNFTIDSPDSDIVKDIHKISFTLSISQFTKFLDYSNIIKKLFNLEFKSEKSIKSPIKRLSKNEKELLYAFTKFSNVNCQKIQELTRLSKPTIIRIKKKLFNCGYLKRITIPNIKKLGFAFSSVTYHKFNESIFDKKPLISRLSQQSKNTYISIIDNEQILLLSLYQNYHQLEQAGIKKKNLHQKIFKTLESPEIFTFQNPEIIKLDFSGLIKHSLGIDVDY